jgi:hypothetical protein
VSALPQKETEIINNEAKRLFRRDEEQLVEKIGQDIKRDEF